MQKSKHRLGVIFHELQNIAGRGLLMRFSVKGNNYFRKRKFHFIPF